MNLKYLDLIIQLAFELKCAAMNKESSEEPEKIKIPELNSPGTLLLNSDVELNFTEKEINSMPKTFKKEFRTDGCTAHIRKRQTSEHGFTYDIRYRRNGYNIVVTGKNLEDAKRRFIEKLKTAEKVSTNKVPTDFGPFAQYYFDTYYSEKVLPQTLKNSKYLFARWIEPQFQKSDIRKITPGDCKALLDGIKAKGLGKTVDDIHSILNQVFKMAIAYGLIKNNPVAVIPHKKHIKTNGKRLAIEDMQKLLSDCKPFYKQAFAIYLYTGIRPGELQSVRIDDKFIVAKNEKQKDHVYREKRIPIMQPLQPYVATGIKQLPKNLNKTREEFKRLLPDHSLKDCRRTFNSHCKECGVNPDLLEYWLGHSKGPLERAYTEFSDEFALAEAQKVK